MTGRGCYKFDLGVVLVSMPAAGPLSASSPQIKLARDGHLTVVAPVLRSLKPGSCARGVRLWSFWFRTKRRALFQEILAGGWVFEVDHSMV